jgi:CheY-like chemotaxis protein
MVVDDDPSQTFTIEKTLKDLGDEYEIIGADSGRECLELLKNNEIPDLILLDIMMPGMNGMDIFERLKENPTWKNIPIIFVTASDDELAENIKSSFGDNYIEKPYDRDELKKRIDKVLHDK